MTGGYNYHSSHSRRAYLFDYETANFTRIDDMIDGRYGHTCNVVRSEVRGSELVVAGGGLNRNSVDILSFGSMEWREGPALPKPIAWAQSVAYGDSFLMMGGGDGGGVFYDTIYEYDHVNEGWIERPEKLHETKYDFTAVMLDSKDVNCGGAGNNATLF